MNLKHRFTRALFGLLMALMFTACGEETQEPKEPVEPAPVAQPERLEAHSGKQVCFQFVMIKSKLSYIAFVLSKEGEEPRELGKEWSELGMKFCLDEEQTSGDNYCVKRCDGAPDEKRYCSKDGGGLITICIDPIIDPGKTLAFMGVPFAPETLQKLHEELVRDFGEDVLIKFPEIGYPYESAVKHWEAEVDPHAG